MTVLYFKCTMYYTQTKETKTNLEFEAFHNAIIIFYY